MRKFKYFEHDSIILFFEKSDKDIEIDFFSFNNFFFHINDLGVSLS